MMSLPVKAAYLPASMPTKTFFHVAVNPQYDLAEQLEHAVAASVYLATEYDDAGIPKIPEGSTVGQNRKTPKPLDK